MPQSEPCKAFHWYSTCQTCQKHSHRYNVGLLGHYIYIYDIYIYIWYIYIYMIWYIYIYDIYIYMIYIYIYMIYIYNITYILYDIVCIYIYIWCVYIYIYMMCIYIYMMYRYDQQTTYRCLNFGSAEIFQTATSNRSVSALCKQYRTSSIGTWLPVLKGFNMIQQLQWLQCVSSFFRPLIPHPIGSMVLVHMLTFGVYWW